MRLMKLTQCRWWVWAWACHARTSSGKPQYRDYLRSVEGVCAQVILVFDAMGGGTRSNVRSTNAGEIDVVYCGEEEADNWILGEVQCQTHSFMSSLGLMNTLRCFWWSKSRQLP